jgi:hypothetical protein
MNFTFNQAKQRFIAKYGNEKFEKLSQKVNESGALVKLTGLTINKGLPPTATDFLLSANKIFYVASKINIGVTVMAALIMLKIWNNRVNGFYQLVSEQHIGVIAERISARWIDY